MKEVSAAAEGTSAVGNDHGERRRPFAIQDVASWVLRVGVLSSISVMLLGVALALFSGAGVGPGPLQDNMAVLGAQLLQLRPFAVMELGILLLVATPVMRVATSIIVFASFEHDRLYMYITMIVLALVLSSLLWLR